MTATLSSASFAPRYLSVQYFQQGTATLFQSLHSAIGYNHGPLSIITATSSIAFTLLWLPLAFPLFHFSQVPPMYLTLSHCPVFSPSLLPSSSFSSQYSLFLFISPLSLLSRLFHFPPFFLFFLSYFLFIPQSLIFFFHFPFLPT